MKAKLAITFCLRFKLSCDNVLRDQDVLLKSVELTVIIEMYLHR